MVGITLEFRFIDFWGRPMFKLLENSLWITSVDTIFPNERIAPNGAPAEIINHFKAHPGQLVIYGSDPDGDPLGTPIKSSIKINFVEPKTDGE